MAQASSLQRIFLKGSCNLVKKNAPRVLESSLRPFKLFEIPTSTSTRLSFFSLITKKKKKKNHCRFVESGNWPEVWMNHEPLIFKYR